MKIQNVLRYAVAAAIAIAAACQHDAGEPVPDVSARRLPASLSITMRASDIRTAIETRNMIDPDGHGGWSEEELLADGRIIRRLTVMLIDSISGEMVAYRHIIYDGADGAERPIHRPMLCGDDEPEGGNGFVDEAGAVDTGLQYSDKVRLTFNYDYPLHGDVERLKHGKYVLMAVANYGSLPVIDDANPDDGKVDHPSVAGRNGFIKQLHAVIHRFYGDDDMSLSDETMNDPDFLRTAGRGISDFRASLAGFYDYVLSVALDDEGNQPYVRKKLDALPLFTVGYIDLQPGANDIVEPISLYRTYARLRIEVRNYSSCPLSIYDLKFSDNFSKDKTYFCRMPGAADIFDGLDYTPGAPDVSYGESIIAFPYYNTHLRNTDTGEVSTPGPDELYYIVEDTDPVRGRDEIGTGQPTVEQGQTAAVFDAYISASRDDNGDKYRYTIELGYDDAPDYPSYSVAGTPLSAADAGSDRYYALKVASASQWLYEASDSRLLTEKLDVGGVQSRVSGGDGSFVWQLRKSDNGYRLQNAGTGDCIYVDQYFSAVCSGMMSSEFSVSGKAGLFTFGYAMNSWYTYYLAYNDKDSSISLDYSASSFELYPVEYGNKARKRVEVVLQTIDDRTSAVADVTEIRRNDFVNVLIEVSYNPDRGDFEFEVQPWVADKGGDITFN